MDILFHPYYRYIHLTYLLYTNSTQKTNALQVAPTPMFPVPQKSVQQVCIPGKDDHLPSTQFQGTWPHPFVQRSQAFLTEDQKQGLVRPTVSAVRIPWILALHASFHDVDGIVGQTRQDTARQPREGCVPWACGRRVIFQRPLDV